MQEPAKIVVFVPAIHAEAIRAVRPYEEVPIDVYSIHLA